MNSRILQIASGYLKILFITFAILALLRGHNMPGGGFIGGLMASLAIIFSSLAYNPKKIKTLMKPKPETYLALGLSLIILSTIPGILGGKEILQGSWLVIRLPLLPDLKLGTPLLFDTGVFLGVIGVSVMFFFTLSLKE